MRLLLKRTLSRPVAVTSGIQPICASVPRRKTMCDYLLHVYPDRLAADGEDLVPTSLRRKN